MIIISNRFTYRRSGLYIVDLDDPHRPPRFIRHTTLWEVADVQWSPHAAKHSWVISTSNQKAMVWNLALPSANAIEHVLHAHTRAITDINFHAHDPERLATCAVDAFVHCWDMRTPAKPVQSFCDWRASATQVKWNRQNGHVVASAHDRFVRIWDDRFGAKPLRSIAAHATKIHGVDFDRRSETRLITCSLDKTVKYWDYSNAEDVPTRVINTGFPVWKARHTPFGDGCLIMPQRGGRNALYLVNNTSSTKNEEMQPVASFIGHTEPLKEFLWRSRGGEAGVDNREFQLVTWSKDRDLRLWQVDEDAVAGVGHIKGQPLPFKLTRLGTPYVSFNREQEKFETTASAALSPLHIRHPSARTSSAAGGARSRTNRAQSRYMTRGVKRQDKISHLNWLSGVRIGRAAFERTDDEANAVATFSERGSYASGSGVPENFGEEVSIVGHKFPKVVFEKIDVGKGEIVLTLNGPWGTDNSLVFIRLQASFPSDYPQKGGPSPRMELEQSKDISEPELAGIESQVRSIADILTARGMFCLEPCLRYLMGEKILVGDLQADDNLLLTEGLPKLEQDDGSSSDDEIIISPPK